MDEVSRYSNLTDERALKFDRALYGLGLEDMTARNLTDILRSAGLISQPATATKNKVVSPQVNTYLKYRYEGGFLERRVYKSRGLLNGYSYSWLKEPPGVRPPEPVIPPIAISFDTDNSTLTLDTTKIADLIRAYERKTEDLIGRVDGYLRNSVDRRLAAMEQVLTNCATTLTQVRNVQAALAKEQKELKNTIRGQQDEIGRLRLEIERLADEWDDSE